MTQLETLKQQLADAEQAYRAAAPGIELTRASQVVTRIKLQIRALETGQDVNNLW